jgi:hypothetical protein
MRIFYHVDFDLVGCRMSLMKLLKTTAFFLVLIIFFNVSGCTSAKGRLEGKVNIGPLTPVERVGVPTPIPPPEVFTSRGIKIIDSLGIWVNEVHFNPNGTYSIELNPGNYRVELLNTGIEHAAELPATVQIFSNQITTLDISIDTGIR